MSSTIDTVQSLTNEIVITERKATTEFKIVEILESIQNQEVVVTVDLGPFTDPNLGPVTGSSRRGGIRVWTGQDYLNIRDTWNNTDLITAVTTILNN